MTQMAQTIKESNYRCDHANNKNVCKYYCEQNKIGFPLQGENSI